MIAATSTLAGDKRILSFTCRESSVAGQLKAAGEATVEVECMGQIPPPFFDYILSRNLADGIFLAACDGSTCHYRLGTEITQQRIERERDPRLRKRIDDRRIAAAWRDFPEYTGRVIDQIDAFRSSLPGPVPVEQEAAA
jgi:coenzyme F420-reducing hydrogenase delta subunit